MKVIEAGEEAISDADMMKGKTRTDPMRIKYLDDFAEMRPILDRPLEATDLVQERRQDKDERPDNRRQQQRVENPEDIDPHMLRLMQQTGFTQQEIKRIRVKNLVSHRVVNQTRMGKIQSLYFLTIAGNENGMVGIGEGKAAEDEDGRRQAMMNAIRNMRPIARYEERTIYGDVQAKVGASVVQLYTRPPGMPVFTLLLNMLNSLTDSTGFGNRCQHLIFELARAAGITDLAARTPRSRNKMNVVKAAFEALTSQRLPEDVAKGRGRKMVDARKVYYGGQVL